MEENSSYPLFLTFREFLYILDNTICNQFVAKNSEKNTKNMESSSKLANFDSRLGWLLDSLTLEASEETKEKVDSFYDKLDSIKTTKRLAKTVKDKINQKKEATFEIFMDKFWNSQISRSISLRRQDPNSFWSQIRTKYKGNPKMYLEHGNRYNRIFNLDMLNNIKEHELKNIEDELLLKERKIFFNIFELYQKWLIQNNYFDIEDMVGFLATLTQEWGSSSKMFNYIIVDEIQDLSLNALELVSNLCGNRLTLCGDSAQNIGRGLNLKFKQIKTAMRGHLLQRMSLDFMEYEHIKANLSGLTINALTTNYRSTQQILQMGNIIISFLEEQFSDELDILPKERSPRVGSAPKIIKFGEPTEVLFDLYTQKYGCEVEEVPETEDHPAFKKLKSMSKFCIIVREEEDKKTLPLFFKDFIVFTLVECKGLEYEHVLLYNFFEKSDCKLGWKAILSSVQIREPEAGETTNNLSGIFEIQSKDSQEQKMYKVDLSTIKLGAKTLANLSHEFKLLYVAITRAKEGFLVYDEPCQNMKSTPRVKFEEMILSCDACGIIGGQDIAKTPEEDKILGAEYYHVGGYEQGIVEKAAWREKGYSFMKAGLFSFANRCFVSSQDKKLADYVRALDLVKNGGKVATLLTIEMAGERSKNKLEEEEKEIVEETKKGLVEAAHIFKELECYEESARCFIALGEFREALEGFRLSEKKTEMANCYYLLQEYKKAQSIFLEVENIEMATRCLILAGGDVKDFVEQFDMDISKLAPSMVEDFFKNLLDQEEEELVFGEVIGDSDSESDIEIDEKDEDEEDDDDLEGEEGNASKTNNEDQQNGGEEQMEIVSSNKQNSNLDKVSSSSVTDSFQVISDYLSDMESFEEIGFSDAVDTLSNFTKPEMEGFDLKKRILDKLMVYRTFLTDFIKNLSHYHLYSMITAPILQSELQDKELINILAILCLKTGHYSFLLELLKNQGTNEENEDSKEFIKVYESMFSSLITGRLFDLGRSIGQKSDQQGVDSVYYKVKILDLITLYSEKNKKTVNNDTDAKKEDTNHRNDIISQFLKEFLPDIINFQILEKFYSIASNNPEIQKQIVLMSSDELIKTEWPSFSDSSILSSIILENYMIVARILSLNFRKPESIKDQQFISKLEQSLKTFKDELLEGFPSDQSIALQARLNIVEISKTIIDYLYSQEENTQKIWDSLTVDSLQFDRTVINEMKTLKRILIGQIYPSLRNTLLASFGVIEFSSLNICPSSLRNWVLVDTRMLVALKITLETRLQFKGSPSFYLMPKKKILLKIQEIMNRIINLSNSCPFSRQEIEDSLYNVALNDYSSTEFKFRKMKSQESYAIEICSFRNKPLKEINQVDNLLRNVLGVSDNYFSSKVVMKFYKFNDSFLVDYFQKVIQMEQHFMRGAINDSISAFNSIIMDIESCGIQPSPFIMMRGMIHYLVAMKMRSRDLKVHLPIFTVEYLEKCTWIRKSEGGGSDSGVLELSADEIGFESDDEMLVKMKELLEYYKINNDNTIGSSVLSNPIMQIYKSFVSLEAEMSQPPENSVLLEFGQGIKEVNFNQKFDDLMKLRTTFKKTVQYLKKSTNYNPNKISIRNLIAKSTLTNEQIKKIKKQKAHISEMIVTTLNNNQNEASEIVVRRQYLNRTKGTVIPKIDEVTWESAKSLIVESQKKYRLMMKKEKKKESVIRRRMRYIVGIGSKFISKNK